MNKRHLWIPVAMLLSLPVAAQEAPAGPASPWSGVAGLGYLATSGNTENTSLSAKGEVAYESGKWLHALALGAINSSQDEQNTAEAYKAGWNSKYTLSDRSYAFGRLDWLKDRFAGFERQFSQTAGYGRKVIDTEAHKLDLEIGAGAKQLEAADGTSDEDLIVRGGLAYKWAFSPTAEFSQGLVIEAGDTNTSTESITALKATLVGDLAVVASYTIRNNSDVPAGSDKTDTFTALSLEYAF